MGTMKVSGASSSTSSGMHIEVGSGITPIQVENQPRPGILTVTLYEGTGFNVPGSHKQVFNSLQHDRASNRVMLAHMLPYAILDFDKSQVSVPSYSGTPENPKWVGDMPPFKLMFPGLGQDIALGSTRINPRFEESHEEKSEWVDVQDGTGKIRIGVECVETKLWPPNTGDYLDLTGTVGRVVMQIRMNNTRRLYALKMIRKANITSKSEIASNFLFAVNNHFIAPLAFALETPEKLYLFSPFIRGGHLLAHLQREQCFDIKTSRFYTAEILCALEYLHTCDIIYYGLKPENIVLDHFGHITLCDFGLCGLEEKDKDRINTVRGTLEYPAPELLLGQDYTDVVDWWTIGTLLYEMLIGLPLFYHEDSNEIHRKILYEPLNFSDPDVLSTPVKDILTKLLDRNPEKRFGVNGVSEIKIHPFFDSIDWHKLLQQKLEPPLKPLSDGPILRLRRQQPLSFSFPNLFPPNIKREGENASTSTKNLKLAHKESKTLQNEDEGDRWTLIWEDTVHEFHFYNRSMKTTRLAHPQIQLPSVEAGVATPQHLTATIHNSSTQSQMQDALEVALKEGYNIGVFTQLVSYGIDLNIKIFGHTQQRTTPLEWATDQEHLGLVKLFLDNGADVNFTLTMFPRRPALAKAVQKGNQELVSALVQNTNRISCTKALGLAVNQQDITIVKILLANGVHCDFEESDRPAPRHPDDNGQYEHDPSEAEEFIPPLVRAVNLGNLDLMRMLLPKGADPNIGYHSLSRGLQSPGAQMVEPCGGVIQLAMDLEQAEMVDCLLDSGADIDLPQPVWQFHECSLAAREIYLKVTTRLRAAVAIRKQSKKGNK